MIQRDSQEWRKVSKSPVLPEAAQKHFQKSSVRIFLLDLQGMTVNLLSPLSDIYADFRSNIACLPRRSNSPFPDPSTDDNLHYLNHFEKQ
jgi:hypothetical protein